MISAQIMTICGETKKIVVAYVPPKTKIWTEVEHGKLIKDTLQSLEKNYEKQQRNNAGRKS